mmetsp:Transcript_1345/g.3126  ORF Transcript_1345/g.3126 Transcript_1345/m.3126 type:complete len:310 (-) Transcript_1345:190-1119(-)|eukprot:CAMPEP_0114509928 /NCGR_PEP_ID=MMETSP0109-20121206/13491_1 /TAXON_ID=29199 /ORGANISM="Chlorarachnion reptans, Strain CCCM449" /LENGTH=309 /DNA_ID=CAMNT_0001689153 /DNA_START=176 /DNA_END=1105 /DNA_ORIENTATION=+
MKRNGARKKQASRIPYKCQRTIKGHKGAVTVAKFNSDGKYCLSGGKDKNIHLWNPVEGNLVKTYGGYHGYEILDICVRKDNAQFASVGGDRTAFMWDVATGAVTRRFKNGHDRRINSCAYNNDATVLFTASDDESICAWDLRSRNFKPIQKISEFKDSVSAVHVSDETIIASGVDGCIRYFDVRMGKVTVDHVGEAVTTMAISNDDQCVLVGCLDNKLRLFDRSEGDLLNSYEGHKHSQYRIGCCLTGDDAFVIGGSEDGKVYFWNLVEGNVVHKLDAHYRAVACIAYHPSAVSMLTSSADGSVKFWTT